MRKMLFHPLGVVIVTLCALVLFHWTVQTRKPINSQAVELLEAEIQRETEAVAALESKTAASDPEFEKEKTIRNELLMQKDGEIILELPPDLSSTTTEDVVHSEQQQPWDQWKALLFDS